MHRYQYTGQGAYLFGLSQGVNAFHHPADGGDTDIPAGATIAVAPGDELETFEPYEHPHLAEVQEKAPKRRATPKNEEQPEQ